MKWYAREFLVDVMGWPESHVGAWIILCSYWWENGPCEKSVAYRVSRSAKNVIEGHPSKIVELADGTISSRRLETERDNVLREKEMQSDRGKKGADARWNKDATSIAQAMPKQSSSNAKPMARASVSVISNSKKDINTTKTKSSTTKFVKPSKQEICHYLKSIDDYLLSEQHHMEVAIQIHDYYESNGWKVGRNPMKDWKATVRNWVRRKSDNAKATVETKTSIDEMYD